MHSLAMSVFLYTCETWTIKADIERIQTLEMRCFCKLLGISYRDQPAKRLCDASSVLVGVELPISSRFQPLLLASKLLATSQKGEHCASVSPCQYIAYPQQVLCSAFSRRQVLLGTVRPQHWICKGVFVWPNGEAGRWGQEKSQRLLLQRRSYKNFSGCKCLHPDTLWQKSPGWRGGRTDMSTSRQHQQEATAARLRGQLRATAGCRRCWMTIPGPCRGDSTTLTGHLSRRRKTSNRNQVTAGASPDLLEGRKPKEKLGLRASPHEPCHQRRRTVAHAVCATHKTDCSRTYNTMAVQLSLERCGVVLLDCSRGGTALGSQPQRSPTSAIDCDSDPSGLTIDGQSRTNGQQALKIVQWNAKGVRLKKTELQHFLKLKAINVCCIQGMHLSSSHRFFIRGYEVFRQDRENRPKGGLLTLVRNNVPTAEIQRSGQADLDTEYLGVKLVLAGTPVTVFNICSPPDKQIQLCNIKVEPQSWIITGDFNSHSPSWGYGQLNSEGEEVENWITENQLILIITQRREETENIILSSYCEERDCSMTDPFSTKELKDALKKMKTKKAPGPDGITGEMLKHLGACSRAVLLKIFNHNWIKGVVPAVWKEAIIIRVPKKGKDKKNPRSYRPISLLSCVGKLLERMINRRLINHLESNNVLSPTQTGYRKHRSTEDQLAYLAQNIEDAFQEKRKVLAVFFDLSNAFDKVWKERLLVKLLRTSVRCKMYMWLWIQHFLFARTARVKLDGILNKKVCLREGVPQGGVLSPILFLVYINDILTTLSKRVSNTLHADDLAIWNASEHTTTATYRIHEAISDISKWTLDWGLEIYTSKTNSTLFSLSNQKNRSNYGWKVRLCPRQTTPPSLVLSWIHDLPGSHR